MRPLVAAIAMVVVAAIVSVSAAEPPGSPTPAPAAVLPHADILDTASAVSGGTGPSEKAGRMPAPPGAAGDQTGGTKLPAQPESSREIHRPAESAVGVERNSSAASAPAGAEDNRPVSRSNASKDLWRASDFLPLAVVLALVLAAAWLVKRYLPARRLMTGSGVLEIVARLPLTPKQSLVLVKMGGRMVLVGVSPERVNTVCLVDDPEQVAELVGRIAAQSRDSSAQAFGQSLEQQADAFEDGADEGPAFQATGGVRGLLEKVRQMSKSGMG